MSEKPQDAAPSLDARGREIQEAVQKERAACAALCVWPKTYAEIRALIASRGLPPAPTAPKEPRRCQRCGGRGTISDMATASIRTDTLPPTIDCPDCAAESGAAHREETNHARASSRLIGDALSDPEETPNE